MKCAIQTSLFIAAICLLSGVFLLAIIAYGLSSPDEAAKKLFTAGMTQEKPSHAAGDESGVEEKGEDKRAPSEWFARQRIQPYEEFNHAAFLEAKLMAWKMRSETSYRGNEWRFVGPTNIGGRISDVEVHPTNPDIMYYAASSGGIFKSEDRGKTFTPIYDSCPTLNTGDICLAPSNPDIIYLGTGEVNPGGGSITYPGLGVFKSADAGKTWKPAGLEKTSLIGRIKVHPTDPNIVYVAAAGNLYGASDERGVYRSKNGGQTWERVLFVSSKTGCVDLSINVKDPNVLYAAFWQRMRSPGYEPYSGAESGIYRTKNGGDSWERLAGGLPSGDDIGRIGIDICDAKPDVVYAYLSSGGGLKGVYKTTNGGDNWTRTNDGSLGGATGGYSWWFSNIRVDPVNPDIVFFLALELYRSTNGGAGWSNVSGGMHVDHHGLCFSQSDRQIIAEGNDGGFYVSSNGGTGWKKTAGLPISQFYSIDFDMNDPKKMLGGLQDNGVCRTATGSMDDWDEKIGGDGLDVAVDPGNGNYVYGESQNGALEKSSNGGSSFSYAGGSLSGTKGWKCPIAVSPQDGAVYFGSDKVYKSTDHGGSWSAISQNLATGFADRGDDSAPKTAERDRDPYKTVTVITPSPSDAKVIYAGCDNGNVWITRNGGTNWTKISDKLPQHWITCIAVDTKNPEIAYVTLSGYRYNTFVPHVFKTVNGGGEWEDIHGNLPEAPMNSIVVDPDLKDVLYVGSDMGVFFTNTMGKEWHSFGSGLPAVVINEMKLHPSSRTLYAATFGRGIYKVDVSTVTASAPSGSPRPPSACIVQSYPNPFRAATTISFSLAAKERVAIEIVNTLGQSVRRLADRDMGPGTHSLSWDGMNGAGARVPAGFYVVRLKAGSTVSTLKISAVD